MIPVAFAVLTLLIGLLSPLWFGSWLPSVRKLRKGAEWIDGVVISATVPSPLSVKALREHDKCGDRVVVAHHLADWTRDLQRKIFQTFGINSVIAFVLVVVFTVKNDPRLQLPTATVSDLLVAVEQNWPFSLLLAGSLIEIVVFVKLVSEQAAKYSKVIDAARPARDPFLTRVARWMGF